MPRELRPPVNLNKLNWFTVDYEDEIYTITLPNKNSYSFDVSDYKDKMNFQEYLERQFGGNVWANDEAKHAAKQFVEQIMNNAFNFGKTVVFPQLRWSRHLIER